MAGNSHRLVAAALALVLWGGSVKAATQDYTAKFNTNVKAIVGNINETVAIPSIGPIFIDHPGIIVLNISLKDISITGCADIEGSQCTYDPDTTIATLALHEGRLEIYVAELYMNGTLFGNVDIGGTGDGWFLLENFDMIIQGPTEYFDFNGTEPIITFTDVALTLDLQQWTVDMRGLTPDSDLTQMMNSVITMLGPEIFRALGVTITDSKHFKQVVNKIFEEPEDSTAAPEGNSSKEEPEEMMEVASFGGGAELRLQKLRLKLNDLRHPRVMASWKRY